MQWARVSEFIFSFWILTTVWLDYRKIGFKASPISGQLFSLFFPAGHVIIIFSSKLILWKPDLSTVYIQHWDKNTDEQGDLGCVRVVWNDSLAYSGGKVQTLKEKKRLILNYNNSLLLWLKRLRKEFGFQSFFPLPPQQSLNDVIPKLIKTFWNQLKVTEKINL